MHQSSAACQHQRNCSAVWNLTKAPHNTEAVHTWTVDGKNQSQVQENVGTSGKGKMGEKGGIFPSLGKGNNRVNGSNEARLKTGRTSVTFPGN